nr:PREDICTED: uncharacterized protein LOC105670851 isoform X1 [Linepithema humile]
MSLLYYLPPEILLIIFDLCDIYTLLQLRRVCKNFDVISTEILNKKSNHLLATNQISKKFRERDGSIRHWRIESRNNINNIQQLKVHSNVYDEYVSNIEVTSQHIISSSSNLIKLQKNTFENNAEEKETIYWKGRKLIRSISLNPTETKVAASAEQWFLIYDINKNCQVMDKCIDGNTCYQLLWQDTHTILMLYESYIKQMDTSYIRYSNFRTSKFVRTWDASVLDNIWCDLSRNLLSLRSDYLYTFMTGTEDNTVILWDQRLSKCIKVCITFKFYVSCNNLY